jgi:MFS family permease
MSSMNLTPWDTGYEVNAVTLLSLGFGLVGLDRFVILPMFPTIMKSLHLSYPNLGEITGILSITLGIAAMFTGRISNLVGRRRVVLVSIGVFSLVAGISELVLGFINTCFLQATAPRRIRGVPAAVQTHLAIPPAQ